MNAIELIHNFRVTPFFRASFVALAIALAIGEARADRVELKTGELFQGKLLRVTSERVTIQLTNGSTISFDLKAVKLISRSSSEDSDMLEGADARKPDGPQEPARARPEDAPKTGAAPSDDEPLSGQAPPSQTTSGAVKDAQVKDEARGLAVTVPGGFLRIPEGESVTVPHAFHHRHTRSMFTISAYKNTDTALQFKKRTLQSFPRQFTSLRILKDEKLKRPPGGTEPDVMRLDFECRQKDADLYHIMLFMRRGDEMIVFTYSTPADLQAKLQRSFETSIESLRFLEPAATAR